MRTVCNVCFLHSSPAGQRARGPDSREGNIKTASTSDRGREREGGREGGSSKGRDEGEKGRKFALQTSASGRSPNQTAGAGGRGRLAESDVRCLCLVL